MEEGQKQAGREEGGDQNKTRRRQTPATRRKVSCAALAREHGAVAARYSGD